MDFIQMQLFCINNLYRDGTVIGERVIEVNNCTIRHILEMLEINPATVKAFIGSPCFNGIKLDNTIIEDADLEKEISELNLWHPKDILHLSICDIEFEHLYRDLQTQNFILNGICEDGSVVQHGNITAVRGCRIETISEDINPDLVKLFIGIPIYTDLGKISNTEIEPQDFQLTIEDVNLWHPKETLHLFICDKSFQDLLP